MCLQQWRSASDTQPTCRSAGFNFHGRRTLSYTPPILSYFPLLGLGIGGGRRKKHEDVVGLIMSFLRSAEGTTADSGA
ncbi:hypothetical protein K469DRAFT_714998 [Zopfia rhizophila CBS 207.26]|uniref:Uncharacterized protein n=1 Tax=Zopfia rhizophila CBS 207.26 TaxID=1314779 RepID=A0A6A6ESV5_9PEZI|nr:hypothetical protein K469DRAFT_714998 [Zopfia rhizophila CBS 207.26]